MNERPFAPACERNREPILGQLLKHFSGASRVLEVGSGTGQHAAWFGPRLPWLTWVATDLEERLDGIRAWTDDVDVEHRPEVMALDVNDDTWPDAGPVDAAFSANTAHILPEASVAAMFRGLGRCLEPGSPFCLYGPFAVGGAHTGAGNAAFDASLRARDPAMGIRDVGWLETVAAPAGLVLETMDVMPSDNRLLLWRKC
ncbi:MAG: DUF938 domain-containing protein [Gammaproteobacteria bacterium]